MAKNIVTQTTEFKDRLGAMKAPLAKVIQHSSLDPVTVLQDLYLAYHFNPKLSDCSDASLLSCVRIICDLGLRIGNGPTADVWLIPYGRDCQVNIGSAAYCKMAITNGFLAEYESQAVYLGDEYRRAPGITGQVNHVRGSDPGDDDTHITDVYCEFVLPDGRVRAFALTRKELVDKHQSRGAADGPWKTDWKEMAFKCIQAYPFHRGWLRYTKHEAPAVRTMEDGMSVVLDETSPEALPPADVVLDQTPPVKDFDADGLPRHFSDDEKAIANLSEPPE